MGIERRLEETWIVDFEKVGLRDRWFLTGQKMTAFGGNCDSRARYSSGVWSDVFSVSALKVDLVRQI